MSQKTFIDKIKNLKEFKDLQRKLVGEESVTWNAKGLAQIVQWSNSIPQFYKNVYKDILQKAISSGDNFIIMESPQVKVDLKKYWKNLGRCHYLLT